MKAKIRMYALILRTNTFAIVCSRCHEIGYVDIDCVECGGKGVRNKKVEKWERVAVIIENIKRDKNGDLTYWTDASCFYEEGAKLIHFNAKDADDERKKRNSLESYLDNLSVIKNAIKGGYNE